MGIELDPEIAIATRGRFAQVPNVTTITGSLLEHLPAETTQIWMFNPFNELSMIPL
jgi:hypothetical protein